MTDTTESGVAALSYLRRPHFSPRDKRTPSQAVLHALPAFLFLAANAWICGLGLVLFVASTFPRTDLVFAILAVPVSILCSLLSWGLLVRCIEVEAEMDG